MELKATYIITAKSIELKTLEADYGCQKNWDESIRSIVDEGIFWTPDVEMASPKLVCQKTPFPAKPQETIPIRSTPRFKKTRGVDHPRSRRLNFDMPEDENEDLSPNERTTQ